MQIFFDIRTLSLFSAFISACIFICMVYIYKNRKTYSGFNKWTLAFMLNFFGFLFLSLRNIIPVFITVVLANSLIVLCYIFITRGLIAFTEDKQNNFLDTITLFAFIIAFYYFSYFSPNVNARIVVISLAFMSISTRCIYVSLLKLPKILGNKNCLLTTAFVFIALWFLLRTILTIVYEDQILDFMSSGTLQGISVIIVPISLIYISIALIIINSQRLEQELINAKEEIKSLKGFLPICSKCKKIRDDKGYWNQIESYISEHSEAQFSHSICPECRAELYPEFYEDPKNT